jgi:hypothetical protein
MAGTPRAPSPRVTLPRTSLIIAMRLQSPTIRIGRPRNGGRSIMVNLPPSQLEGFGLALHVSSVHCWPFPMLLVLVLVSILIPICFWMVGDLDEVDWK